MNLSIAKTLNYGHTSPTTKKGGIYLLIGLVALTGLIISAYSGILVLSIIIAAALLVLIYIKPNIGFGLLTASLFLEADSLSLNLPIGKVRFYHIIIVVLFLRLIVDIARGKARWRKSVLDLPLIIYLLVNGLAIILAPDKMVALKIMGLLGLMAMLYWSVFNYARDLARVKKLTNWFLGSALIVGLIGLYQIVAAALSRFWQLDIWAPPVMHSNILPFGRPYATFVEPDWFGTFIMIAALVSFVLFLAKCYKNKQLSYLVATLFFLVLTGLSAVRGAWLGLAASLAAIGYLSRNLKKPLSFKVILPAILALIVTIIVGFFIFPDLASALMDRVLSLFSLTTVTGEPRFVTMQSGWKIFLSSPWLGYGPGAFKTLGVVPFVTAWQALVQSLEPFQTNAIISVLVDTGVAGLAVVLWGSARLYKRIKQALTSLNQDARLAATDSQAASPVPKQATKQAALKIYLIAWMAGLIGMLVAYQVTAGLWLGLSWFVLAMSVATLTWAGARQKPDPKSKANI